MGSTQGDVKKISSHKYSNEINLVILKIDTYISDAIQELKSCQEELYRLDNHLRGTDIRKLTNTKVGERTPIYWFYRQNEVSEDHKCSGGCG